MKMNSNDYMEGYKQGINDVLEKISEAQKNFEVYGNKDSFKGLSRKEIVFECWRLIENAIKDFKNE